MQIKKIKSVAFDAGRLRVGIVVAEFNGEITERLLSSALATLKRYQVKTDKIRVLKVAGSVEIPCALDLLAKSRKVDALVALGCIIRGETSHYEYVCKMVQEGVLRVMLDYHLPVGFGVLTVENQKQAEARVSLGGEAVEAVLRLKQLKV